MVTFGPLRLRYQSASIASLLDETFHQFFSFLCVQISFSRLRFDTEIFSMEFMLISTAIKTCLTRPKVKGVILF